MRRLLLLIALVTGALVPMSTRAAADARPDACGLPGMVRAPGAGSCPPIPPARTAGPGGQFLGIHLGRWFGGLTGKLITPLLNAIVGWVTAGAAAALRFTVTLISATTSPALESSWFSSTYWRVGAISALLTVPFLCAAAIHALPRSDLSLLARAAFGYLPLAMIGVAIAGPLVTLLLSATDEMCAYVAAASGHADATFLGSSAAIFVSDSVLTANPFLAFFAALITVGATLLLWIELLIRAAAVEVIVLMLPLFFAAMVWPARRVWAIRAVETLFALILSKFAIVAVLSLGGAAISESGLGPAALLTGAILVLLATATPWALLRILPLHEVAAAAAGGLSQAPQDLATRGAARALNAGLGAYVPGLNLMRGSGSRSPLDDPGEAGGGAGPADTSLPDDVHPITRAGDDVVSERSKPEPVGAPVGPAAAADSRPEITEPFRRRGQLDDALLLGDPEEEPPADGPE